MESPEGFRIILKYIIAFASTVLAYLQLQNGLVSSACTFKKVSIHKVLLNVAFRTGANKIKDFMCAGKHRILKSL